MEDSLVLSSAIIKSSFRLSFLYWRTNILFSLSSQSIFCRAEGACYVAACPVWRTLRTAQRCSPHSLLSHHRILSVANPWCTQSQVLSASTAVVIPQKWKCREPLQGEKKKKLKKLSIHVVPQQQQEKKRQKRNHSSTLITLNKRPDSTYSQANRQGWRSWDTKAPLHHLASQRHNIRVDILHTLASTILILH